MSLRVISHGGGVQTTAILVLAATGRLDYDTFLFANVGDDSEHPGTLRYLREIAAPYAAAHGITIHELEHRDRHGDAHTIREMITREGSRADIIPVRLAPTGAPASRSCTGRFKIEVVGKWLKEHGASEAAKATVAVGISADEVQRANKNREMPYEDLVFPLLRIGDTSLPRPMTRRDCADVIRDAGLPLPGKSACYFCPYHRPKDWRDMATHDPALFERAAELEDFLLARRAQLGKNPVFLSESLIPLREAFGGGNEPTLPGLGYDQHCDNGWCMT